MNQIEVELVEWKPLKNTGKGKKNVTFVYTLVKKYLIT